MCFFFNVYMSVCLSICSSREITTQLKSTQLAKTINQAIIGAPRFQHTTVRLVREAAGRALANGERGCRPNLVLLSARFIFISISLTITFMENVYSITIQL